MRLISACSGRNYNFRCINDVFGVFLRESARTAAKSRTNLSTNSGKATKRLGRLAPNLAHMRKFICEWITPNKLPLETQGATWWVLGGKQFKSLRKLPDWLQFWFTSADASANRHRLNPSRSSIPDGALGGGCHKFKSLGKLSNDCTDWHQIWYMSADSSGNGHRLNASRTSIPQGVIRGGGRGSQIPSLEKLSQDCTDCDWNQIWHPSADSSGN